MLYALGLEVSFASLLAFGAEIARVGASARFAFRDVTNEPNPRSFVLARDSLHKSCQKFPRTRRLECRAYFSGNTHQVHPQPELASLSEIAMVVLKATYLFAHGIRKDSLCLVRR
jgi:hypothetical protein